MSGERVESAADLAAMPDGTVVRSDAGTIACRFDAQHGVVFGDDRPFPWATLRLPVVVLYRPDRDLIAEAEARGAARAADRIAAALRVEMRRHDAEQIGFSAIGDAYAEAARIAEQIGETDE
ncbi:hypothetical protein Xcel_0554 [Xylanimonas cellulosilytica DSM 15894]|uniref:Uncharacterized protein n=1 Tax=Xylanimonas cellulosilytica (strain DSM 15894 / JCM 12276 / CECT 5975 / KCTC 9989 / LMG 20990 / NBRC 107835 / XIL07) TaxID=446471 RepID=D1BWL1_XYLCX|nr:hypothetical protein [Xylanimonas cellulosilytica]ACZ29593.1 hypothetical protein Xcel_0554 [Xylanimonas cellulosilytica DSM 15894]